VNDPNYADCEAEHLDPPEEIYGKECKKCGMFFYCDEDDESDTCLICMTGE